MASLLVNDGPLIQILKFTNGSVEVNIENLQKISTTHDDKSLLAFAQLQDCQPSLPRTSYGYVFLRGFLSNDGKSFNGGVQWRGVGNYYIVRNPVHQTLSPGLYVWSNPFSIHLETHGDIDVYSTLLVYDKSQEQLQRSEMFENINSMTCSMKIQLADVKNPYITEDETAFKIVYEKSLLNTSIKYSVLMTEVAWNTPVQLRLHSQPLFEFLENIAALSGGPVKCKEGQIDDSNDPLSLLLLDYLRQIGNARKKLNQIVMPTNAEFLMNCQKYNDSKKMFKKLSRGTSGNITDAVSNISKVYFHICTLFQQNTILKDPDFDDVEHIIYKLNKNSAILESAYKLLMAVFRIYNYSMIGVETNIIEERLRKHYNDQFSKVLEVDIYQPEFLNKVHNWLVKSLTGILEKNCTFTEKSSNTNQCLASCLKVDFQKHLDQNEINILKLHRKAEKSVENLKMQYIDEIETFIDSCENNLSLSQLNQKHLLIKESIEKHFEANISSSIQGTNGTEVYRQSLCTHIEKYKEKISKDFNQVSDLALKESPQCTPINCISEKNCTPLLYKFDLDKIAVGALKEGQLRVLKSHKDENSTQSMINYDGKKFVFPSDFERIPSAHSFCIANIAGKNWQYDKLTISSDNINLPFTTEFLLSLLLRKLKQEVQLCLEEEYVNTAITVPYSLSPGIRREVEKAALIAGFSHVYIISDISAVAFYCCLKEPKISLKCKGRPVLFIWYNAGEVDICVFEENYEGGKLEMKEHCSNYIVNKNRMHPEVKRMCEKYSNIFREDNMKIEVSVACSIIRSRTGGELPKIAVVASVSNMKLEALKLISVIQQFCANVQNICVSPLLGLSTLCHSGKKISKQILEIPNVNGFDTKSPSPKYEMFTSEIMHSHRMLNVGSQGEPEQHEFKFYESTTPDIYIGILRITLPAGLSRTKGIFPIHVITSNGVLQMKQVEYAGTDSKLKILDDGFWRFETPTLPEKHIGRVTKYVKYVLPDLTETVV